MTLKQWLKTYGIEIGTAIVGISIGFYILNLILHPQSTLCSTQFYQPWYFNWTIIGVSFLITFIIGVICSVITYNSQEEF
jgi:ABC-type antimicrobial peptide transport system permease subunit